MSNAKDLADLKSQLDDGIARMKEAFGVLEHDLEALSKADAVFHHAALDDYQSDDNHLRDEGADKVIEDLKNHLHATMDADKRFAEAHQHLVAEYHEDLGKVDSHMHEHQGVSERFVGVMGTFASSIEHAAQEVGAVQAQHAHELQGIAQALGELGEHVMAAATETDTSVRQAQAEALDKAMQAMKALVEHHAGQTLPQLFDQAGSQLLQGAENLGHHVTQTADTLHNEMQALLHDISAFAAQSVHDKVEQKFQVLMQDALGYLAGEIQESMVVTVAGATTTGILAPILPELIALKIATAALKEAIEIFKALESVF